MTTHPCDAVGELVTRHLVERDVDRLAMFAPVAPHAHSIKREEHPDDLVRTGLGLLNDLSACVCGQSIGADGSHIVDQTKEET